MKTHTSSFKENIKLLGRELDSKIIYELNGETIELGSEQLNSITPHYEGAILKSVMKQLDIDSNVEIPIGTILTYQFGLKVGNGYEYINFGNYVVKSVEKQEDTRSWQITCYDKMLYAMKDYENSDITFPITIRNYINAICEKVGLVFANESEQFANYDKVISNELYLDSDGRSLGYTFRDVLDELAEVTASTICINKDDELEIRYIKDVGELTNVSGTDLTLETDSEVQLDNFELEGKTTQETRSGKNLLKIESGVTSSGITTVVNSDGSITYSGTVTETCIQNIPYVNTSIPVGTYTFSRYKSLTHNTLLNVVYADNTNENKVIWSNQTSVTFTTTKVISRYRIMTSGLTKNTAYNETLFLQLESGSSSTTFEKYGISPSPDYPSELVSVGYENLFDKDTMVLNAFINAGNNQLASSNDFRTIYIPIKANTTYTLQKIASNRFIIGYSNTSYSIPQTLTNVSTYSTDRTELTFTTPNNVKYVFIMVSKITDDTTNINDLLDSIQIEESTQTHSYIPYGKYGIEVKTRDSQNDSKTYLYTLNQPLRSISDTKDLLYIKNGMLYVDRKIKTVILNGTESWTHFSVAQGHLFRLDSIATDVIQNNNAIPMSNYYHAIAYSQQPNRTNNDIYISLIGQIDILNNNYTNINDFKTWLSTHNTEVQYILAEPYTEKLGSVETPSTYNGITYLNAPTTMNVSYVSEIDTIDEEYLKDVNVNFGEKFGKVNTLVLSRGGDGDKIALSIPSDLDDDDKVAIQITDNQIMNDNNRADYMQAILNQLNGLEYYINDFSSTGICYYDLCDRYQVKIGENVYKCIIFNDEIDITQGLEEFIYTNMQEENEQEYKYMSSDDRGITQANVIAKKNEGSIQEITQKIIGDNGLEARVGRVETTQTATERTINVISENITYQYDEQGNPISSDINSVKTTTGFTFNADGLTIADSQTNFIALHDNTGTYYKEGNEVIGQYTKDGSKQKDLQLFGVYYYGMSDINDTPMFVAQLYTDENGNEAFGHFYNRGD